MLVSSETFLIIIIVVFKLFSLRMLHNYYYPLNKPTFLVYVD